MLGSKFFTVATAFTMIAILCIFAAVLAPVMVEVSIILEALAVFIALTGLAVAVTDGLRTSMTNYGRAH